MMLLSSSSTTTMNKLLLVLCVLFGSYDVLENNRKNPSSGTSMKGLGLHGGVAYYAEAKTVMDCKFVDPPLVVYYNDKKDTDEFVTIERIMNPVDETFTMKITYTGGRAYIGVGVSTASIEEATTTREEAAINVATTTGDDDDDGGNDDGDGENADGGNANANNNKPGKNNFHGGGAAGGGGGGGDRVDGASTIKMSPSNVIIGRGYDLGQTFFDPISEGGGNTEGGGKIVDEYMTSVMSYHIINNAINGSGIIPIDTIVDGRFVQTQFTSTLTFTASLHVTDYYGKEYTIGTGTTGGNNNNNKKRTIIDTSHWIYAIGLPNNQWEGMHKIHGNFNLTFPSQCKELTLDIPPFHDVTSGGGDGSDETTESTVVEETTESETQPTDNNNNDTPEDDANVDVIVGDVGVDDEDHEKEDAKDNNELDDANASEKNDAGNSNSLNSAQKSNLTNNNQKGDSKKRSGRWYSFTTKRKLYMIHGVLMFIAWGICAPIAIGASILRRGITKVLEPKFGVRNSESSSSSGSSSGDTLSSSSLLPLWLRIHSTMNVITVSFTIVAFILAVIAAQDQDDKEDHDQQQQHFQETTTHHHIVGLVIFIVCIIQAGIGYYYRPKLLSVLSSSFTRNNKNQQDDHNQRQQQQVKQSKQQQQQEQVEVADNGSVSASISLSSRCLGITNPPSQYQIGMFNPKRLFNNQSILRFGSSGGGGAGLDSFSDDSTAAADVDSPMSTPSKSEIGIGTGSNSGSRSIPLDAVDENQVKLTSPTSTDEEMECVLTDPQPYDESESLSTPSKSKRFTSGIENDIGWNNNITIEENASGEHVDVEISTSLPDLQDSSNETIAHVDSSKKLGNSSNGDRSGRGGFRSKQGHQNQSHEYVALAWRFLHRVLGAVLLGLAWYNCHTGIDLTVENWNDQKDWTGIFWGITIGISGMVVLLSCAVRNYV